MSGHREPKPGAVRYPFADLVAAMGGSPRSVARALGISGRTEQHYRTFGMSEKVADRMAVRLGLHPFVVWPDMLAEVEQPCRECGQPFVPKRRDGVFCTPLCNRRWWGRESKRRRRSTPEGREENRRHRRAYYAVNGEYERSRERRRYAERKAS